MMMMILTPLRLQYRKWFHILKKQYYVAHFLTLNGGNGNTASINGVSNVFKTSLVFESDDSIECVQHDRQSFMVKTIRIVLKLLLIPFIMHNSNIYKKQN